MHKTPSKPRVGKGWIIFFIFEVLSILVMGLVLVWSGIERTDTTYFINIARTEVREKQLLHNKLEIERERLLSPYELRRKAVEFGMREPDAGQVRKMEIQ